MALFDISIIHSTVHTAVQVQFLNTTFSVMEGEIRDLKIFPTSTAPFNITLSASFDANELSLNSV